MGAIGGTVSLAIGNGATLELNGPGSAGETVTFLGTQGTLQLDHSLTSPFIAIGQISNLTGTVPIHDNIDLRDLAWNGNGSANYVASTATSGVLTVNDGSGHSEVFNLVNYTGAGTFTAQDDGHGGTLVFDPPAPATLPEFKAASVVFEGAEASSADIDGNGPLAGPHSTVEPLGSFGVDQDMNHFRNFLADASNNSNASDLKEWHFLADQAQSTPTPLPQGSQLYEHTPLIAHVNDTATQEVARMWGGAGGDTMAFKPEIGPNNLGNLPEHVDDRIDLEWSAIAKFAGYSHDHAISRQRN